LPAAEAKEVKSTPGSLEQALEALEADHAFLLRGDVFTKDVIETWLNYKRDKEIDAIRLRPHPYEPSLVPPRLSNHRYSPSKRRRRTSKLKGIPEAIALL
jgi:hypothetical protein